MKRLTAPDVLALARVVDLVAPLRTAFARGAETPSRGHYSLRDGERAPTLLVMPAWRPGGPTGVKLVTVFPDNPASGLPTITGEYLLFSGETGQSLALIDGPSLTLLRTAAVSALAADLLVPETPDTLLVVGTGALSEYLIEGHAAVRPYRRLCVWGRDPDKARALVARSARRGLAVEAVADLETAVRQSDVISCATMATEPLIHGGWLGDGAHLDLVGGFRPGMREADDACLKGAYVVADSPDAAVESGDLADPLARGVLAAGDIVLLADLASGAARVGARGRTVFKSVGYALADLAAAEVLYDRSRAVTAR